MERAAAAPIASNPVVEHDRFGERRHTTVGRDPVASLCLRHDLATVPAFEFALRERVSRLSGFKHPAFVHVRGVERLAERGAPLAIVSDRVEGLRLSDLLARVDPDIRPLDITSALRLTRQLAAGLAALHDHAKGIIHGAVTLERLIVTPNARLLVADYALGSAIERLEFSLEQYWTDLRVAVQPGVDPIRFDERTDVLQTGLVSLALILGRPIADDEYPMRIPELVASAWAVSARGGLEPLPSGVRRWLVSALQLDPRASFTTLNDARAELDSVVNALDIAGSSNLETLLASLTITPAPPARAPEPPPPPAVAPPPVIVDIAAPAAADPLADLESENLEEDEDLNKGESDPISESDLDDAQIPDRRRWVAIGVAVAVLLVCGVWGWSSLTSGPLPTIAGPAAVPVATGRADTTGGDQPVTPPATTAGDLPPTASQTLLAGVVATGTEPTRDAAAPMAAATPEAPTAQTSGWIAITTPIRVDVIENGFVMGSSGGARIPMAAGEHQVELVNEALGYRATQTVTVPAGGSAALNVTVPLGSLSINAEPWAEVWIRGEKVGDTPMANVPLAIGTHEVVLKHPELGERVHEVTVTVKEGARLSVDLRNPR